MKAFSLLCPCSLFLSFVWILLIFFGFVVECVRGATCDALPFRERLQRWSSPAVPAAAARKNPAQEQKAQGSSSTGGHPQAEGRRKKEDFLSSCAHLHYSYFFEAILQGNISTLECIEYLALWIIKVLSNINNRCKCSRCFHLAKQYTSFSVYLQSTSEMFDIIWTLSGSPAGSHAGAGQQRITGSFFSQHPQ